MAECNYLAFFIIVHSAAGCNGLLNFLITKVLNSSIVQISYKPLSSMVLLKASLVSSASLLISQLLYSPYDIVQLVTSQLSAPV